MEQAPPPPASKRQALETLLDRGLVMVHLDARREGVRVPDYLQGEHHLRLNLSYRFGLPNLDIDEDGVTATLSFRGQGFLCEIPWDALFAMTQPGAERGWLWPADLPIELLEAFEAEEEPSGNERPTRPFLEEIPPAPPVDSGGEDEAELQPTRRQPHLRLIK